MSRDQEVVPSIRSEVTDETKQALKAEIIVENQSLLQELNMDLKESTTNTDGVKQSEAKLNLFRDEIRHPLEASPTRMTDSPSFGTNKPKETLTQASISPSFELKQQTVVV